MTRKLAIDIFCGTWIVLFCLGAPVAVIMLGVGLSQAFAPF